MMPMSRIRRVKMASELTGKDVNGQLIPITIYQETFERDGRIHAGRTIFTTNGREITERRKDGTTWVALEIAPTDIELIAECFVDDDGNPVDRPAGGSII
jgi:hypothetical protein